MISLYFRKILLTLINSIERLKNQSPLFVFLILAALLVLFDARNRDMEQARLDLEKAKFVEMNLTLRQFAPERIGQ